MSESLVRLVEQSRALLARSTVVATHWDGCIGSHPHCAVSALADAVEQLQREREDLHDWFECERCDHNIHHREPRGDRECEVEPGEGVEFCTFLICGRCSNRTALDRDAARARVADLEARLEKAEDEWLVAIGQRDKAIAENAQLRREAGGLTEDGRTVPELEAEVVRLREGIAAWLDDLNPDMASDEDRRLAALLDVSRQEGNNDA